MKKCIVLDLDNTLWGGIVGEDGPEGIELSLGGRGSGFIAFQQALLDLHHRGILLAINSRNNFEDAMEVIRKHPNMILKEDHFASLRINWNDKAENIREIASELNIGTDSLVFFDDDPTNRAAVQAFLPEVEVPEMPKDPSQYVKFLLSLPFFSSEAITDEDKMRGNLYVTERLRREKEKLFSDKKEFFKNLGLELRVFVDDDSSLPRLAQLTEKTNQFNVKKIPMSENDVLSYITSPEHAVFFGRMVDSFGDYGITNFAIVNIRGEHWEVEAFLMSCRVIGRGAELAFLSAIAQDGKKRNAKTISMQFIPTEKNKPAEEFVKEYFKKTPVRVESLTKTPDWITVSYGKVQ